MVILHQVLKKNVAIVQQEFIWLFGTVVGVSSWATETV